MLSINTNLQSLIVQNNLTKSTTGLNQAIERMTTGFKINHASDNAAGYSIAQNMTSKLNSYEVAQDNISAGLDLLATTQDTISLMQSHGQRIHALITQAQNGTYGAQSLAAINSEIGARIAEIDRLYMNTEYNGIDVLNGVQLPDWTQEVKANAGNVSTKSTGFIDDIETVTPDIVVTEASALASAISSNTTIGIANAEVLAELATLVNSGNTCSGKTIILTDDIDLSAYQSGTGWTAIGNYNGNIKFQGNFDGQGHKVKNLKIDRTADYQGLFGYATGEIKNVGIENCDIKGGSYTGGFVGRTNGAITNCYATGSVAGTGYTGGLAGYAMGAITNSYATGTVTGSGMYTGGLAASASGGITNCYSTCSVTGGSYTGGLAGSAPGAITNCFATGSVTGGTNTGGLAGNVNQAITNCYATGSVTGGGTNTGGLAGNTSNKITNCYATGTVTGSGNWTGGLAGNTSNKITNCYATGNVTGADWTGGLVGRINNNKTSGTLNLDNLLSTGDVSNTTGNKTGSLIGGIVNTSNGSSFSTINISNAFAASQGLDMIGFEGRSNGTAYSSGQMEDWLANISTMESSDITLQVGVDGGESSQITFNSSLSYDLSSILSMGAQNSACYDVINKFLNDLSERATSLGAVSNRLESALESTAVSINNLTTSRSTLRDADVAKESSQYIKNQILQQAAATLLATANQTPSIALQLL